MFRSCLALALLCGFPQALSAADAASQQQAIGRAAASVRSNFATYHEGYKTIAALALLKAGMPPQTPEIQDALSEIQKRIDPAKGYTLAGHRECYYIAGVDAVLLADLDGEKYRNELMAIQKFIEQGQAADGSWDYPGTMARGDTSVTHYALLGLWACARADVPSPPQVWSNSIKWHLSIQNNDGGFSYKPSTLQGFGGGASVLNMTVNAVGSMSIAWMHLSDVPPNLDSEGPKSPPKPKPTVAKNNSVLEAVPVNLPPAANPLGETGGIPEGTAKAMKRAYAWIVPRFTVENPVPGFYAYYFYSLERMTALVNVSSIGSHEWYGECSDLLVAKQNMDGSWGNTPSDTSLAILALAKSTAKLLKRRDPVATFGNGLLQGGRGLPDATGAAAKAKADGKPATPLDQLLASLSKADNLNVEEVQEQLVEQVQIGDRRELIQQKGLLVKLIQHPNVEIRRTAAWALGRTNDLTLARYLITALEDPEVDVNIEAHNALCWISRKPAGFDLQLDPFEGLPLDAGVDIRQATLKGWRDAALKAWGDWYLKNRPYKDRGDEFEAKLREKLATLK